MSRSWLLPLVPLYAAAAGVKNVAYDRRWVSPRRLRWPVISIGNLSVGGTGKTPLVIHLAELLAARGLAVDVLSRGYGRASKAVELVDPEGSAARFGDEPLLIARRTGVPVVVGAERYEAGLLQEQRLPEARGIHLLDDGFQHRRLARDVDIVVLPRWDAESRLLPAGRLREPFSSLRRAHIVVLREEDEATAKVLRKAGVAATIWWMRRETVVPEMAGDVTPNNEAMGSVVAFCGVGRPEEFFRALEGAGLRIGAKHAYADHHRYTSADMEELIRKARDSGAAVFVTTEKDEVRLEGALRQRLEQHAPLRIARLSVSLRDEGTVISELLARVSRTNLP